MIPRLRCLLIFALLGLSLAYAGSNLTELKNKVSMCSNKKNSEHCQAVAARFADYQHLSEELSYDAQQFGQQIMLLQSRVATLKQRLSQLEQSTRGDVDQRSDKLRQALLDSQQQLTMRLEMVAYYESPR